MSNVSSGDELFAPPARATMAPMVPPDQSPPGRGASLTRVAATAIAVALTAAACTTAATSRDAGSRDAGVARAAAPDVSAVGLPDELSDRPVVPRPATVAVVGDSLTVAAADHLRDALVALDLDVLAIDAQVGRRMTVGETDRLYTGADVVELLTAQLSPELWVIAVGTNDVGQYDDEAAVAEHVAALLDRLPDDVPVVWVDTWIRGRDEQTARVNRAIRQVLDRRDDAVVVEWSAHATDEGVISGDGVHLTDGVGRQRFAAVVAAGVEALVGPPGVARP